MVYPGTLINSLGEPSWLENQPHCCIVLCSLTCRVGLTQMVTVEIKIPNRLVGLGEFTRHYYVAVMAYVYVLK